METPRPGRPKKVLSEEERQLRDKWEQRVQEEKETMRKEQERFILSPNLTEEQKRIRRAIRNHTYNTVRRKRLLQARKREEARKAKANIQPFIKVPTWKANIQPLTKAPTGKKPNRVLSAEEQRLWDTWEQKIDEEKERMCEERKQHISRPKLTDEQKRLRIVIKSRDVALRAKNRGERRKRAVRKW